MEDSRKTKLDEIMKDLERRGIVASSEKRFAETLERGRALSRIKKSKLYRSEYRSFSSFVEHEFGCTSQQARNLITASEVYDELDERRFNIMPKNAKQCMDIAAESRRSGVRASLVWEDMIGDGDLEMAR